MDPFNEPIKILFALEDLFSQCRLNFDLCNPNEKKNNNDAGFVLTKSVSSVSEMRAPLQFQFFSPHVISAYVIRIECNISSVAVCLMIDFYIFEKKF